jgi:DNA polymerase/3'-5' exonuclease PolX
MDSTSFSVNLRPELDEENIWTGELEVSILYDKYNPMDRVSFLQLQQLAEIVACSIAYMERNPEVIADIEKFIAETETDENENDNVERKKHSVEHVEGNVVKLSFNSNTKGSA